MVATDYVNGLFDKVLSDHNGDEEEQAAKGTILSAPGFNDDDDDVPGDGVEDSNQ
jgi:hypothetical protein